MQETSKLYMQFPLSLSGRGPFRPVPSESPGDFGKGQETSTQCGQVQHCLGPHGSRQLLF